MLLFALTLTSPVSLTALAFCISTAYGTIPALFVLALCLLHRFLICRRVHSLADFVLDTRQSSHLLAMSTLLNVFGFLHAGGLGYLVVSPPAQDWVLWVAVFWFPPFALIFWIVVLTRLRRCTSAMLGAHGTA